MKPTIKTFLYSAAFAMWTAMPFPAMAEDDVGFPQLKQSDTFVGQIFWLAVCFGLLYVLMSRIALPRVGAVLETRHKTRQTDLDQAKSLNDEAARVKKVYEDSLARAQETAQQQLRAAEESAAAKVSSEEAKFGEAARKRLAESAEQVEKAKADALGALADIAAEAVVEISSCLAGVQVGKPDAKTVVSKLMKEKAA